MSSKKTSATPAGVPRSWAKKTRRERKLDRWWWRLWNDLGERGRAEVVRRMDADAMLRARSEASTGGTT